MEFKTIWTFASFSAKSEVLSEAGREAVAPIFLPCSTSCHIQPRQPLQGSSFQHRIASGRLPRLFSPLICSLFTSSPGCAASDLAAQPSLNRDSETSFHSPKPMRSPLLPSLTPAAPSTGSCWIFPSVTLHSLCRGSGDLLGPDEHPWLNKYLVQHSHLTQFWTQKPRKIVHCLSLQGEGLWGWGKGVSDTFWIGDICTQDLDTDTKKHESMTTF